MRQAFVTGANRGLGLAFVRRLVRAGDAVAALCSLYVVFEAWLAGVPRATLARMLLHVGLDWAVGSLPLVGDLFDVAFRANRRNVRLFRRHVGSR
jgi:nucleoside-diphosphate-sugar epimerase